MTLPNDRSKRTLAPTRGKGRGLEQRVLRRFRALRLSGNPLIVVGFSGGVDSLCLATALGRLQSIGHFRIHLVHIDHRIRDESGADAISAEALAANLGLPMTVRTLEPGLASRAAGVGLEEAGRRERYLAFADACAELGAEAVALAHHEKDQAESVLLHLVRGSGLSGAAAMSELTEVVVPWWRDGPCRSIRIWRPLLAESRDAIEACVASFGGAPIVDASNADPRFLRNWLRLRLLPGLEERSPGAVASLGRFAEIAAGEDQLLADISAAKLAGALNDDGGISWPELQCEPLAIRRRAVKAWLSERLPGQEVSLERVEAVMQLAERRNSEKVLQLSGGVAVWSGAALLAGQSNDICARLRRNFAGPLAPDRFQSMRLQSGVPSEVDGWRVTAFGAGSVELRSARHGDRFAGAKESIRELARGRGVHPLIRERLLVGATSEGPIWVAGLDATDRAKTRDALEDWRFELTKLEETR